MPDDLRDLPWTHDPRRPCRKVQQAKAQEIV